MAALAGSLGSVIGYLGAEVAEPPIFERLFFPARFYNDLTPLLFLKLTLLFPMGGPLHRAALQVLDIFRAHGLYAGRRRGTMLGTAFFSDSGLKYSASSCRVVGARKDARNAMWVRTMQAVRRLRDGTARRAIQPVFQLSLRAGHVPDRSGVVKVREDVVTWRTVAGIVCSELTAVVAAIVAGVYVGVPWLAGFLLVPLMLKVLAMAVAVKREPLRPMAEKDAPEAEEIFEVDDLVRGFFVVRGAEETVLQFFRHYAHPLRDSRFCEVVSIATAYLFVLYFPVGLLALLWMDEKAQYLWLGYQIYIIVVMHLVRVCRYDGCGRTEERLAKHLEAGEEVFLVDATGNGVAAVLEVEEFENVKAARERVDAILSAGGGC